MSNSSCPRRCNFVFSLLHGVVTTEEPVLLQGSGAPSTNRFHALGRETLEFLKLAVVDLESGNGLKFVHRFTLIKSDKSREP